MKFIEKKVQDVRQGDVLLFEVPNPDTKKENQLQLTVVTTVHKYKSDYGKEIVFEYDIDGLPDHSYSRSHNDIVWCFDAEDKQRLAIKNTIVNNLFSPKDFETV